MSGHSSGTECPNCGKEANLYEDWKPVTYSKIECLECGCCIEPAIFWLDFDSLNDARLCAELEPLTEEQFEKNERKFDYFEWYILKYCSDRNKYYYMTDMDASKFNEEEGKWK